MDGRRARAGQPRPPRSRLTVNGRPVGRADRARRRPAAVGRPEGAGSIIVLCATDAPLLPHQCTRLAQRCALGIGRTGGAGEHSSGDLILAFSTVRQGVPASEEADARRPGHDPADDGRRRAPGRAVLRRGRGDRGRDRQRPARRRDDDRPRRDHRARARRPSGCSTRWPGSGPASPTRALDRRLHRGGRRLHDRPVAGSEARRLEREQPPRALEPPSGGATSPARAAGTRQFEPRGGLHATERRERVAAQQRPVARVEERDVPRRVTGSARSPRASRSRSPACTVQRRLRPRARPAAAQLRLRLARVERLVLAEQPRLARRDDHRRRSAARPRARRAIRCGRRARA